MFSLLSIPRKINLPLNRLTNSKLVKFFSNTQNNSKVVVISGASSGIGEELGVLYSKSGVNVVLSARRVEKLQSVYTKCIENGAKSVEVIPCDVSKEEDCKTLIKTVIAKYGAIDTLILNAGVGQVSISSITLNVLY
jgi:short-subunit dehydrogenase